MTRTVTPTPWTSSRALALAREQGKHSHPTIKGFHMVVSKTGKAVWTVRYRDRDGKDVTKVIGEVAALGNGDTTFSLEQAIERARILREQAKCQPTEMLTFQRGFEDFIKNRVTKTGEPLADRTVEDYNKRWNLYLSEYGELPLAETGVKKWLEILRLIKAKSPAQANGCKALISGIYTHQIMQEALDVNPIVAVHLSRQIMPPKKRTRRVQILDLPRFLSHFNELRSKPAREALMLMLLTGMRHSALLQMKWEHLDLPNQAYVVPPRAEGWKKFEGAFALSYLACALLQERHDAGGPAFSPYIWPGRHGKRAEAHMDCLRGTLVTLCDKAELPRVSEHDIRRTFATLANIALNDNSRMVARLLAHKWAYSQNDGDIGGLQVTLGYIGGEFNETILAANRVAEFISEVCGLLPLSDESADLLRRKGINPEHLELVELDDEDEETPEETAEAA